jgi:hypothetical protein
MDKELYDRLDKLGYKEGYNLLTPHHAIVTNIAFLETLRAYIIEKYPDRFGDSGMLEDAIEIVKDYQ